MKKPATIFVLIVGRQLAALALAVGLVALVLSTTFADSATAVRALLLSTVVIGVGIWIASAAAARRLAAPLEELAEDLAQAKGGHTDRGVHVGAAEAQRLSEAISQVEEELAGVIDELRGETALREQILASMREGVILADATGDTIYCNHAAEGMFGGSVRELLPSQLEEAGEHEFTVHHPSRRDLRATSTNISDGRTLAVIQDETARKRVESIRRDFVANASHELKTPVSAIMVTAETVQQALSEDPEGARKFAANLVREAARLSALVQDLLNLARLEKGEGQTTQVDLVSLVSAEVDQLRERVQAKGLDLELNLDESAPAVGTAEDLSLMVRNLLDNAISYTATGSITVGCRRVGEAYEISVADTGVGIPSSDLERIFERFYRVDKARSRDTGGTGLGLSIVRHVAESLGGQVEVSSELGRGSTFTVRLPI
ncbi:MAG: ATP-binding protein [Actinomycetota bacterium]